MDTRVLSNAAVRIDILHVSDYRGEQIGTNRFEQQQIIFRSKASGSAKEHLLRASYHNRL